FIAHLLPSQSISDLKILFLIGPGNNGGDGLIMGRHLQQAGAAASFYHWKERQLTVKGQDVGETEMVGRLEVLIQGADYIIDALLGIGRARSLPDDLRSLLARVQQERQQR